MEKITRFIPSFMKPYLRPLYERAVDVGKRLRYKQKSKSEVHAYWRKPPDAGNFPTDYLEGTERSQWLVALAKKHLGANAEQAKLLEIGCNIGRNLEHFHRAGFRNLNAIEINAGAIEALKQHFPELGKTAQFFVGPVEEGIKTFGDGQFDIVYTMAVLEHVHADSNWIFGDIARVAKRFVITIEDEREFSDRHFPRKYDQVFGAVGLKQIEAIECVDLPGLGAGFWARVFTK
jgi:SAM-dependent methyltransferase